MSKLKAKAPEEVKPGHSKILIFGAPGAGKTWFGLSLPKPILFMNEPGNDLPHYMARLQKAGGGYFGPEDGSCDFDEVLEQIKALATEKHQYETLVIDSITKLFQIAVANEAERLGDRDAFGASKKPAIAKMRKLINWLMRLDMNVVMIAHQTTEWGLVNGQRQEIGKMPDCWDKLLYEMNLILRIEHVTQGIRQAVVTKSRLLGFPEFSRFALQEKDLDVGYQNFSERYGRDYIEAKPKTIELCTADQIEKIDHLVSVFKLADGEMDKVLTKAGVDEIKDLSVEQADKVIQWLENKIKGEKK